MRNQVYFWKTFWTHVKLTEPISVALKRKASESWGWFVYLKPPVCSHRRITMVYFEQGDAFSEGNGNHRVGGYCERHFISVSQQHISQNALVHPSSVTGPLRHRRAPSPLMRTWEWIMACFTNHRCEGLCAGRREWGGCLWFILSKVLQSVKTHVDDNAQDKGKKSNQIIRVRNDAVNSKYS